MSSAKRDEKGRFIKGSGMGRPKGLVPRNVTEIREAFQKLITDNLENMSRWLDEVAEQSPEKALNIMDKFGEYTLPKLQRVELSGIDGDDINMKNNTSISLTVNDESKLLLAKMQESKSKDSV